MLWIWFRRRALRVARQLGRKEKRVGIRLSENITWIFLLHIGLVLVIGNFTSRVVPLSSGGRWGGGLPGNPDHRGENSVVWITLKPDHWKLQYNS